MKKLPFLVALPFLILNGFFVAKMTAYPELARVANRPELVLVSAVFVLIFALPSFWATLKWLGLRRGVLVLLALSAFAIAIETFAILTGFPYGHFTYGEKIGAKLLGVTPWTVPFAWTPLLLACYALAWRWTRDWRRVLVLCALLTVALDAVIDPGAVSQKFWRYHSPGIYYGVPWSNFAGWLLSGFIGGWLCRHVSQNTAVPPVGLMSSAFLILVFWSSVCAWSSLWIPALSGLGLTLLLGKHLFYETADSA